MRMLLPSVLIVIATATASSAAGVLRLAPGTDPAVPCPIILPADATPAEHFAARELAQWGQRICGAAFAVTSAPPAPGIAAIALQPDAALGAEEYRIRVDAPAGRLLISGGRPRGVLYGVYALLQDEFGCRWFARGAERIPPRADLAVPADLDRRGRPRFEYREVFWTEAFDGDWAARNRLNSANARLDADRGGRVVYGTFVHTFNRILDPDVHFAAHPEYFSMVSGRRVSVQTQLCLSNPEVFDHALRAVREWIRERPEATIFSVSQNDWLNPCACPDCKAVDDAEGSHAGSLLTFVNKLAGAIEKDHPNVAIDTLAYQYTRKPPKTVKPRPNVIVRLCSIECCFGHPLDGCPEVTNTSFIEDLRGWHELTDRLYVWDYTTDFAHYLLPFPNLRVLDANLRTFAANGVAGVFEQGNYSAGGGGELAELRAWVMAQLLWDPSRDGAALVREFVEGVYGPAAGPVQRFIDLQHDALREGSAHPRIFGGPNRSDLSAQALRQADALLAEADGIAVAKGDAALAARIRRLRMPVWYAQVWQMREPAGTIRAAAQGLRAAAVEFKLTNFRESAPLAGELRKLDLVLARTPRAPEPGVTDGEDLAFNLYREGELVALVADAAAGDGMAARQAGRTTEWSVQWPIPVPEGAAGRHRLRARIRIDRTGETGPAFHAGVYDYVAKKGAGEIRVAAKDLPGGEYRMFDIAEFDLRPGLTAYVAPDDNATNVPAIFIDRFELVPAGP